MSILIGDCRTALASLPERSVHCVVTSPPYWGLRDYGTDGQIGLEPTPEAYITTMVEVFRAVRRVLRDDGVCWINIGDSYASGGRGAYDGDNKQPARASQRRPGNPPGLKPGDLVGIPWRLALALQADGWYLRSDVIWAKRNTMPESVAGWRWERCRVKVTGGDRGNEAWRLGSTEARPQQDHNGRDFAPSATWSPCPGCPKCESSDGLILRKGSWRPTKAHEYVFLLAKSAGYYCDGEAVREQLECPHRTGSNPLHDAISTVNARDRGRADRDINSNPAGRNLRDVWRLSSMPSKLRHFAMMPPALVETCIKAGCPERCCSACGAPWVPVVDRTFVPQTDVAKDKGVRCALTQKPMDQSDNRAGFPRGIIVSTMTGHRPTCRCGAAPAPGVVLDPFMGAGTVAGVAEALGRRWTGCELSAEYAALVPKRIAEVTAWFARQQEKRAVKRRLVTKDVAEPQIALFSMEAR